MTHPAKNGLTSVQTLSDAERGEIEALGISCSQHENTNLSLYLTSSTHNETHHFFYHQGGALVGVAMAPSDDPVEVLGMVHPHHRRGGIGRALLEAVRQECQRRGVADLLLVCERAAPSGVAFARAVGAAHEFSEYRMELDRTRYAQRPPPERTLDLWPADERNLEALVDLWTASWDVAKKEARAVTAR